MSSHYFLILASVWIVCFGFLLPVLNAWNDWKDHREFMNNAK